MLINLYFQKYRDLNCIPEELIKEFEVFSKSISNHSVLHTNNKSKLRLEEKLRTQLN